ncbi:30S ribosomal protein S1 [Thermodesulforhabdus norvegica]|uniref:Small ribosomal subunit protein bS1 n=1 Tax=Thermodesulforhabdus norvegica TaxID=39841 RepID=A0A1I4QH03_9BACT|nr:30S ribosomal protein S1 [Thermodesulforhabdus norvegica]SFM39297.1 SSU ribosomal protein S1P [Thermodesulforhabdus norvegica]
MRQQAGREEEHQYAHASLDEDLTEMDPRLLEELYEKSFQTFQEGEVVKGKVVHVTDDYVVVDIGYKSEGIISIDEFRDNNGNVSVKVGDEIEVLLEYHDDEEGVVYLSKEKATKIKVWDEITRIYEEDGVIKGKIVAKVKGGLSVDIGIIAFLPGSQVDLRPVRDLDALIGKEMEFKILKCNKRRRNVVLSRRAILEKEREAKRAQLLKEIEEGKVFEGVVKNITDYGVFVDLGGVDGLLHITDMSWGRVGHPSEMFQIGDPIKVMILHFDRENERVSLGLKQLFPDPWAKAAEKYPEGSKVKGKVVSITDYGAFVELEKGVEGLIHISEMSWTEKIRHPSKILSVGDEVEAVVLSIDPERRRISLGLKQLMPNPWDIVAEKYPVGTIIEGKVKNITDFGIFIGIDEGIDGLVHISDISWTKRIRHPSEVFQKGQVVRAKVLHIDKEEKRFSLGIKQLEPDPWESIDEKYPVGSVVSGVVSNVTDFGVFVELEEGIEGLVHVSEIDESEKVDPLKTFQIGQRIEAKVINVSSQERKIGLSIKRLAEEREKETLEQFKSGAEDGSVKLGEVIKKSEES